MVRTVPKTWTLLIPMVVVYGVVRLLVSEGYGFHRDEFLYLAQGRHLAWGFWSNPPGPGFMSWLTQQTLGDSVIALRIIPSALAAATAYVTAQIAREFGANRFGQFLAAFSIMVSGVFLRVFLLFNPVPFDVFYWSLLTYILVRYIRTSHPNLLLLFGLICGFGILNKYSVALLLLPLLVILPWTSLRSVFLEKKMYAGVILAALVALPNLLWQYHHNFPVTSHMAELQENQLANVTASGFIIDQVLFNANILWVWISGLLFCFSTHGKKFRTMGFLFLGVIGLILALQGKSYYTLGIYPVMIGAGARMWERWSEGRNWLRFTLPLVSLLMIVPILPVAWPFLSAQGLQEYGEKYGMESFFRWEDGQVHTLPQDFADMFGWQELAELVGQAHDQVEEKEHCLIYCSNFGQAGAVDYFGKKYALPPVHSFADSWKLWLPEQVSAAHHTLIYVNDNLGEDVEDLFASITLIGQVENEFARERGTLVYRCEKPRSSLADFFNGRMKEVREASGLPE